MANLHDVARAADIKDEQAKALLEGVVSLVEKGEVIRINGFGTFKKVLRKGRTVRSPMLEGGSISYDDYNDLVFKSSPNVSERLSAKKAKKAEKKADDKKAGKKAEAKTAEAKTAEAPAKKAKRAKKPAAPAVEGNDEAQAAE